MQFIFLILLVLCILFWFLSMILGMFLGGKTFFDSFKKGAIAFLVISIIIIFCYYVYNFISTFEMNHVLSRTKRGFNKEYGPAIEYLKPYFQSAKSYYWFFCGIGVLVILTSYIPKIGGKRENAAGGLGLFIIGIVIWGYSEYTIITSLIIMVVYFMYGSIFTIYIFSNRSKILWLNFGKKYTELTRKEKFGLFYSVLASLFIGIGQFIYVKYY